MEVPVEEQWQLAKSVLENGGLSVIVGSGDCGPLRGEFAAHGIAAEVVATDPAAYPDRGAALKAAFERTRGEYVLALAGADPRLAALLPRYLGEMTVKCADIVIGSKRHPESRVDYPRRRRVMSGIYFRLVRTFLGVKITDTESGIVLYRRETLKYALERMLTKAAAFELEILAIAAEKGARIFEAPVGGNEELGIKSEELRRDDASCSGAPEFGHISRRFAVDKIRDTLAVFYRLRWLHYYAKCMVPKPLDREPTVSVVIACPRRSWMLDECLAGLAKQTYRNFEVIVLPDAGEPENGNGGTHGEGSSRTPPAEVGSVQVIPTGKVRPAEKRNLGIRAAKGEIVAFIDDDAYPDPHWLEYAVKYFGEPSIGAVGGPGVTPPGDRRMAHVGGRVYDNALVSGNYRYRYKAGGVRMDVEDYPSCNLFVRRDLMLKFGGYRTDFWPGEDTLLCKDILDNWKRIVYDPWVVVYHHRRALFMPHLRQLGRYGFHRGYFCKRYPSNSLRLSYFIPTAFVAYSVSLALLPALAALLPAKLLALYALPMAAYLALLFVTTFALNPVTWLLTAAGVIASHWCYGIRFAQGICAGKAPCEYIGKDHVGEVKNAE